MLFFLIERGVKSIESGNKSIEINEKTSFDFCYFKKHVANSKLEVESNKTPARNTLLRFHSFITASWKQIDISECKKQLLAL